MKKIKKKYTFYQKKLAAGIWRNLVETLLMMEALIMVAKV